MTDSGAVTTPSLSRRVTTALPSSGIVLETFPMNIISANADNISVAI